MSPAAAVRFVFPHAPVRPVTINNGMRMLAWYDIAAADLNNRADITGVRQSQGEIEALIAEATRDGLTLVTTEKDLVRLRTAGGLPSWAQDIVPFAVTLEFDDAAGLRKFVSDRLFKAREKKFRS